MSRRPNRNRLVIKLTLDPLALNWLAIYAELTGLSQSRIAERLIMRQQCPACGVSVDELGLCDLCNVAHS